MRRQLLGDGPDAFKWDFVHWLCTRSQPVYSNLVFVPMLRPDELESREGRKPHEQFNCRPEIRRFLLRLRAESRLDVVRGLGSLDPDRPFEVLIWPPADRYVGTGVRTHYWTGWPLNGLSNALVFVDPDNGFETATRKGHKWVRHAEIEQLLHARGCEGVVVYQNRPQRERWDNVFAKLCSRLGYATFAATAFNSDIALLMLAGTQDVAIRLDAAASLYSENHSSVCYRVLDR